MSPQTMTAAPIRTRVVVVGPTSRYRERAQSGLGELGDVDFTLTLPTDPEDITWLVARGAARRRRARRDRLRGRGRARPSRRWPSASPRIGVVVVCEHLTDAARELHALPKWGWTRELRTAVQRARLDGNPLGARRKPLDGPRRDLRDAAGAAIARR